MGQKYEAPLAFLVDNISSLLDLATITLFKFHYNSIKQAIFQSTNQASSHKIIETKQCMQACKRWFYLEMWFLIGYKHSKTLIGHFIKWQNYLQKIFTYKPFLNQSIILCG